MYIHVCMFIYIYIYIHTYTHTHVHMLLEAFFDKDLSTTMNQEESVARGCALMAAMLSPLYKVRDFKK